MAEVLEPFTLTPCTILMLGEVGLAIRLAPGVLLEGAGLAEEEAEPGLRLYWERL